MPASAYPAVVTALFTRASAALPDVIVSDGEAVTHEPGSFLMIGSANADQQGNVSSGDVRQSWANANGTTRDEEGEVACLALAWNGEGDQQAARDAAFAVLDAVAALCKSDPQLGVPELLWTSFGTQLVVEQAQDDSGALCLVEFQVHYRARV